MEEDKLKIDVDGEEFEVFFRKVGDSVELRIGDKSYKLRLTSEGEEIRVYFGEKVYPATVKLVNDGFLEIDLHGIKHRVKVKKSKLSSVKKIFKRRKYVVKSPIPGRIVSVEVSEGEVVDKGQTIVIIEAMKMRNEIKSPKKGIVKRIGVSPGSVIDKGRLIAEIESI